ncbi:MAG: hypothetical protein SGPRY_010021 [Prymnesium sp.]
MRADVTTVDLSLRAAGSTLSEAAASLLSVSSATAARTASAVHSSEPLSLPANSPPSKACAPGCELRGNCNLELGRCDCPPFMGGPACSDHLFESCSILPGLREVAPAPCLRESLSQMAPVSCECLRECERIGLMGLRDCYVIDVSDQSLTEWVRSQRTLRGLTANLHFWPAALNGSDAVSVSKCSGRGVFAPAMHGERPPAGRAQCWCYAGFAGVACERRTEERELRMCINSCNRRGKVVPTCLVMCLVPSIGESIFLSPFGGGSAQRGGHRKGHDIVVPPVLNDKVQLGLLNHVGRKRKARQNLAFFQVAWRNPRRPSAC